MTKVPGTFEGAVHIACNADMRPAEVRKFCVLDETGKALMQSAMNQLQLSARAYHRVLKLARTIADLAGSENIGPNSPGGGAAVPAEADVGVDGPNHSQRCCCVSRDPP